MRPVPFMLLAAIGFALLANGCSSDLSSTGPDSASAARGKNIRVTVTPPADTMVVGDSAALTATISGSSNTAAVASWSSSDTTVVTISAKGVAHGRAAGKATIVASYRTASATASVVVGAAAAVPVAKVTVALNAPSIAAGQSTQATATAYDANGNALSGRSVAWATGSTAVATVSASGLVSAVGAGSTAVTATVGGVSGSASLTVTAPSTFAGVTLYPGDSLQLKVAASPAGTQFLLKAGTYHRQTITPKDDMSFVGEPGAIMDGDSITPYAFETLATLSKNVTIKGLVITRYAPPYQRAAIQGDNGTAWLITDNEISYSAYECVHPGPHTQVLRNYVHHCMVGGISGFKSDSALIEGNEVAFNGLTMTAENPATAEAAGMKFMNQYGLTIRNNNVHDNMRGIWIDTGYLGTLIEGDTVVGNMKAGIWIEATYGAVVRNNRAELNGGTTTGGWLGHSGIQVTNSPNVEIYGNTVTNNMNGIGVMETSGYPDGPFGPLHVQNLYVHDNVVTMQSGTTGVAQNVGDLSVFTSWNNRFVNNSYVLGATATFAWNDSTTLTAAQWRAAGQDVTGTFSP